jgi:hypothetical protein
VGTIRRTRGKAGHQGPRTMWCAAEALPRGFAAEATSSKT